MRPVSLCAVASLQLTLVPRAQLRDGPRDYHARIRDPAREVRSPLSLSSQHQAPCAQADVHLLCTARRQILVSTGKSDWIREVTDDADSIPGLVRAVFDETSAAGTPSEKKGLLGKFGAMVLGGDKKKDDEQEGVPGVHPSSAAPPADGVVSSKLCVRRPLTDPSAYPADSLSPPAAQSSPPRSSRPRTRVTASRSSSCPTTRSCTRSRRRGLPSASSSRGTCDPRSGELVLESCRAR